MVTNHPQDGQTPSPQCSPTIQRYACRPQDGHPPTVEWSTIIPGMIITFSKTVTHHFQDGQLDLEFDSSVVQFLFFFVYCSHTEGLLNSKNYTAKFFRSGQKPFQTPPVILRPIGGRFGFFRQCGIAGSEPMSLHH